MKIFLYSSSVYSCYLFLISSPSVRSIPFLSFIVAHLFMKCSLGISKFLKEISSLSHSIVFLYFFTLIPEEVFLISPCYSLELCIQMGISFLFFFPFHFPFFTAICKLFMYDLNQITYDYIVEVKNRFNGLDLRECLMN